MSNIERQTWFESGKSLEYIRQNIEKAKHKVRIATGFFTIKGWNFIRKQTLKKQTNILVGLDNPGRDRARMVLIQEIMRDLGTGIDIDRRKSVRDIVTKIQSGEFGVVDARARDHHNKLYICDEKTAIQTSSNLTGKGLTQQVEGGSLITKKIEIEALIEEFDDYFSCAEDLTKELLDSLLKWLEFATPWEIYLKTLLALETIKPVQTTYKKIPLIYQKDMISLTLKQINEYGGSMLVASTGLGKTVMGTFIAIQLKEEKSIDKIMIICPKPVKKSWQKEMREANLYADYLTLETLDKKNSDEAGDLEIWEEVIQEVSSSKVRYLLIFDESHKLRKRYPDQFANKYTKVEKRRERKAFTRINVLVNSVGKSEQVKVLLLTGSPYATDIDNVNVQLSLLPHTATESVLFPEYFNDSKAWRIKTSEEFVDLPVAHQLTTPYVAKNYASSDDKGLYLFFGEDKKYFPDVNLVTIDFLLPVETKIKSAIIQEYFDLNTSKIYRKNIVKLVKTDWASSPLALQETLEKVCDTPQGKKAFNLEKSEFIHSQQIRQLIVEPIIETLEKLTSQQDKKLQALIKIIEFHAPQEKIIIFCERYPTAFYLENAIKKHQSNLKIFCTIEQKKSLGNIEYVAKSLKNVEKAISKFAPIANNYNQQNDQNTYNVFITTDNYGIGVNMQDASIVVNYDIAWTPIEPIQRAGRILRLWNDFRQVTIYTFVPMILNRDTTLADELVDVRKRWENLIDRHEASRKLTDLPVLTDDEQQLVNMPDFAPDINITKGHLSLSKADDKGVSTYYQHLNNLHFYREDAQNLPSDLVSALNYSGEYTQVYILLLHKDEYFILLYNVDKQTITSLSVEKLLNTIECDSQTETAIIDRDTIEKFANIAIKKWCEKKQIVTEQVYRECTLYLNPQDNQNSVKDLLDKINQ